jgi:hypothetical protein
MATWKDYGEARYGMNVGSLKSLFSGMTENEQRFTNDIRHLYYMSKPLRGTRVSKGMSITGSQQIAGSYVFYGAHVVVEDKGARHGAWKAAIAGGNLAGGDRDATSGHGSSHYKGTNAHGDQWEIHLPSLGCILFGVTPEGHTWFQNESWAANRSGFGGWARWAAHGAFGFGAHIASGKRQVGALGYSDYTEKTGDQLRVRKSDVPNVTAFV